MRDVILTNISDDSWSGRTGPPPGGGVVRGAPYDHCNELVPLTSFCVQDQASWIRPFVFVYLLVGSWIRGRTSCRMKCTARCPDAARLNHSPPVIALPQHRCEPARVVFNFVVYIIKSTSSHHGACTSYTNRIPMKRAARTQASGMGWISADLLQHLQGVYRICVPPLSSTATRFRKMLSYLVRLCCPQNP